MSEEVYKPNPEEQAKLEKSRILSDAELLQGGAEYKIDESGNARLEVTPKQLEYLKNRDIVETARLELEQINRPDLKVRKITGSVKIDGELFILKINEFTENNKTPDYNGIIQGDNFYVKGLKGDEAKEFFDLYINFVKKEPTAEEIDKKNTDKLLGR